LTISTHVLDTASGRPAAGVPVSLSAQTADGWRPLGGGETDADGRLGGLGDRAGPGVYRLTFAVDGPFYPEVAVTFRMADAAEHYHVPLLLSPYGYSTYRGS
jgi:5-hydroxyisourate hydrolase